MSKSAARNVVFVTGAFVSHIGWKPWQDYFESKGYTTLAPSWPYKEGSPEELRKKHPDYPELGTLTLKEVIDNYIKIIQLLDSKPVVIGHSLGGMMTQIIVNRGHAAAGIAIHPVPPLGVFPYEFSFLRGGWRSLGLFSSAKKTYLMSFPKWQYAFTNGMPLHEQKKAYEENVIPESKTAARNGLSSAAKVDFNKAHAPLLITSGNKDTIIPAHLNYRNYKKYKKREDSIIEYKEFNGRNHFVVGQSTWKEDADYILEWIGKRVNSDELQQA